MRARRGEGRGFSSPGPRLFLRQGTGGAHSFLALLLFSASQEVVRGPPYGVRGSAYRTRDPAYRIPYRIRHSAYRSRRGCFEYADFELLHTRYRSAGGLRRPLANRDHRFVGGSQCFLALPEGHTLQLAALPATEGYEPLEPFHLT